MEITIRLTKRELEFLTKTMDINTRLGHKECTLENAVHECITLAMLHADEFNIEGF